MEIKACYSCGRFFDGFLDLCQNHSRSLTFDLETHMGSFYLIRSDWEGRNSDAVLAIDIPMVSYCHTVLVEGVVDEGQNIDTLRMK